MIFFYLTGIVVHYIPHVANIPESKVCIILKLCISLQANFLV